MRRRDLIGSVAAIGSFSTLCKPATAMESIPANSAATFVLVHGAWHGGWCWSRVADRLRAAGHTVFSPTLTGLGERRHLISPSINLDTHIVDIMNLIEYEELHDVVLVGHSYAGVVISGVADRIKNRIKRLIYLDALLIGNGRSIASTFTKDVFEQRMQEVFTKGGGVGLPVFASPQAFGVKDENDVEWVRRRLTPHPIGTYTQKLILQAPIGNGLPKTYIDCTENPLTNLEGSKSTVRNDVSWEIRTLKVGHDAMLTDPKELTAMLLSIPL